MLQIITPKPKSGLVNKVVDIALFRADQKARQEKQKRGMASYVNKPQGPDDNGPRAA